MFASGVLSIGQFLNWVLMQEVRRQWREDMAKIVQKWNKFSWKQLLQIQKQDGKNTARTVLPRVGLTSRVSGCTDSDTEILTSRKGNLLARFFWESQDHVWLTAKDFNSAGGQVGSKLYNKYYKYLCFLYTSRTRFLDVSVGIESGTYNALVCYDCLCCIYLNFLLRAHWLGFFSCCFWYYSHDVLRCEGCGKMSSSNQSISLIVWYLGVFFLLYYLIL